MDTLAWVGFCGSRHLGPEWRPLVAKVVEAVAKTGRGIATGCCVGADAMALRACFTDDWAPRARSLRVFAAFGEDGAGDWVGSATRLVEWVARFAATRSALGEEPRITVEWWAGGDASVPLKSRLRARTRALVEAVAASGPGRGLIAFVVGGPAKSPGTWGAIRLAVQRGIPVIVFPCGCTVQDFPAWKGGKWVRAGQGIWALGWRWLPDEGAEEVQSDASTQAYIQYAQTRAHTAPEPSPETREEAPWASTEEEIPPYRHEGRSSRSLLATWGEAIADFFGWKPRPRDGKYELPPLPSLFNFHTRWYSRRRRTAQPSEPVPCEHRFGRGFVASLLCAALLLFAAGFVAGKFDPFFPKALPTPQEVTLDEYHDQVWANLHALVDAGCVRTSEYCLAQTFTITRYPGGGPLTVQDYYHHLFRQMVELTESDCFHPSDQCLELAYQAVELERK